MLKLKLGRMIAASAILILTTTLASAQNHSLVQFGRTIRVEAGQPVSDVTCILCSIYLRGPATGDITAIGGVPVAGDVTAIGGDIRAQSGVAISGDATAIAGAIRRQADTQIGGESTALEGKGWLFLIFVVPFIFLGAMLALIVWVARYLFRSPNTPVPAR